MFLRGGCLLVGKKEKKITSFFSSRRQTTTFIFYKKQTVKSFISSKFSMELADAAWSLQCAETTNKIFAESRTCECGRRYGQTESNDSEANFTQSALSLTGADAAIPRWRFSRRARAILLRWSRTLTPTLRALQQFMLTSTYQNLCAHAIAPALLLLLLPPLIPPAAPPLFVALQLSHPPSLLPNLRFYFDISHTHSCKILIQNWPFFH